MKNNDIFDINSFLTPDVSCAPVYVWVWNDVCTKEIIDTQLNEMQHLGIRAFYILPEPKDFRPDSMPTNLTPGYLTDEFFGLCEYAIKQGNALGMNCWIYDEGGWPSGSACGKVTEAHPEFSVENSRYPDLLNRKATEFFIEITHEKYASATGEDFKNYVTAVFTDEPKAFFSSSNKELKDKYEELYGESILPYIPLIEGEIAPAEENVHVLHQWYDLCSHAFCENFLLPCKKWANEKGIDFTGHLDVDHSPDGCMNGGYNFNLMRALRCFDIPGVDFIWRQIYPEDRVTDKDEFNAYNGFFPRYASSAAAQNGTKFALSEIFGVAGASVTYDIMLYTVGYGAVRGINIFNPFNFPLGRNGQLLAQELPVFTEKQPFCKYLSYFNRYTERLSYISSLGERVYDTALYYPVSDFQGRLKAEKTAEEFDILGRTLENMLVDFDIADDDVLQNAEITDNGYMCIGSAEYKHIIIPENAYIPEKTRIALDNFIKLGGCVSQDLSDLTPAVKADGDGLRAMHRKLNNGDLLILFRETGVNGDYSIHLPSAKGYLLDLNNGELQYIETENGIFNISLAIGETAVILLTDDVLKAEKQNRFNDEFNISGEFTFRKETELVCDKNGFDSINYPENAVSIHLGDWSSSVGNAFSGSCVYETSFTLPAEKTGKKGELDSGDVHFTASAYLNGHHLGVSLAPPYRFKIPDGVLRENNTLKIVVTNTSANWYVHTDYFNRWKTEELSPYFEGEIEYAKDFLSGGLYGPVTLYTE
ncbi:MAG: beta galactosidase jelly roll domain-containing protein [Clostridia bacterium]|nr:beta galactosidase jelly roll domain-containing protein [Clostridia bacterium]